MATDTQLNVRIKAHDDATRTIKGLESSIIRFVGAVTASIAAISVIAFPVKSAKEFEAAMLDVQKTTGFTDTEIKELSKSLLAMSRDTSVAAVELGRIAAIAGQLGLGSEGAGNIAIFTESVAKATVTLGLSAEAAANTAAQMKQIFKIPLADTERVISVLNELSNTSVATAAELGDITRRVGAIAGLSFQQAASLAAYARDLGVSQEVAGTSYAKFFANMQSKAARFAEIMNISQTEWIQQIDTNAVDALTSFAGALSKVDKVSQSGLIKELLGEGRQFSFATKIVNDAAGGFETLGQHIKSSSEAYKDGGSSLREYEKQMEGFGRQIDKLKAIVVGLGIEIGNEMLPQLAEYVKQMQVFFQGEEIREFLLGVGESFKSLLDDIGRFVSFLSGMSIEWTNLIQVIILFLGLGLVKSLVAMTVSMGLQIAQVFILFRSYQSLTAGIAAYTSATAAASAATLGLGATATTAGAAAVGAAAATKGSWFSAFGVLNLAAKGVGFLLTKIVALHTAAKVAALGRTGGFGGPIIFGDIIRGTKDALKSMASFRGSFTRFIGFLGAAGQLLLSTALGPIGAVAIGLYAFWEEILAFFGFVDREALRRERAAKAATRKAKADLEKAVNDLNKIGGSLIGEGRNNTAASLDVSALTGGSGGVDTINGLAQEISGLSNNYLELAGAIDDAQLVNDTFSVSLREATDAYYNAKAAMEVAIDNGDSTEDVVRLSTAMTNAHDIMTNFAAAADTSANALGILKFRADSVASALAGAANPEFTKFTEQAKKVAELNVQMEEFRLKLKEAKSNVESANSGGDTVDIADTENELKRVQSAIARVTGEIKAQEDAVNDSRKNVNFLYTGLVQVVDALASGGNTQALDDMLGKLHDAERLGKTISNEQIADTLGTQVAAAALKKALTGELIKAYDISKQKALALAATTKGAYDNLQKTLSGVLNTVRSVDEAFDQAKGNAELKLSIKVDDKKADEELNRALARVEKKFNRRVANIKDPSSLGGKRALANLEKQRDLDKQRATNRRQVAQDERDALTLTTKQTTAYAATLDVLNVVKGSLAEQKALKQRISDLTKQDAELEGNVAPGIAEKRVAIQRETLAIQQKLAVATLQGSDAQKKLKEAFNATGEAATKVQDFSAIREGLTGALFENTTALPEATKKKVRDDFKILGEEVMETLGTAIISNNDSSDFLIKSITAASGGLRKINEDATATLRTLGGINEEVKAAIANVTKSMKDMVLQSSTVKESFANIEIKGLLALPSAAEIEQSLGANFTKTIKSGLSTAIEGVDISAKILEGTTEAATFLIKNTDFTLKLSQPEKKPEVAIDGKISKTALEEQLKKMKLTVPITPEVEAAEGGFIRKNFASGGYVSGPGSGTSDSIFAKLSNGEYVMDAKSTSFFGAAFLKKMQSIASNGGKLRMPAFAAGGLVSSGASSLPSGGGVLQSLGPMAAGIGEKVELVLIDPNTGREAASLGGSRASVQTFVDSLKRLRR